MRIHQPFPFLSNESNKAWGITPVIDMASNNVYIMIIGGFEPESRESNTLKSHSLTTYFGCLAKFLKGYP